MSCIKVPNTKYNNKYFSCKSSNRGISCIKLPKINKNEKCLPCKPGIQGPPGEPGFPGLPGPPNEDDNGQILGIAFDEIIINEISSMPNGSWLLHIGTSWIVQNKGIYSLNLDIISTSSIPAGIYKNEVFYCDFPHDKGAYVIHFNLNSGDIIQLRRLFTIIRITLISIFI